MRGREEAPTPDSEIAAGPVAAETRVEKIVVLPFENLGSEEEAYFAAGISEEITGRLGSVSGLGVISRKSALRYANTDKTIEEIGEELGVGYVLEGTVRWAKSPDGTSRVRITPQLIRVSDDSQLWSSTYDRVIEDIFEVQSDIASQVINEMGVTLLEPEQRAVESRPTENIEAYQAYLRGLEYANHPDFTELNMRLTIEMFQRAASSTPPLPRPTLGSVTPRHATTGSVTISPKPGCSSPGSRRRRPWPSTRSCRRGTWRWAMCTTTDPGTTTTH